jgi:hypothetical protein
VSMYFFRLKSVLIWEIEVQSSEYLLHVSKAAGKLLVLKLATLIVAFLIPSRKMF